MTKPKERTLTQREADACLAGIRLLMAWRSGELVSKDPILDDAQVMDIATNGGKWGEPDNDFLDNLACAFGSSDADGKSIQVGPEVSLLEKMAKAAGSKSRRKKS